MRDYYAPAGVFSSTEYVEEPLAPPEVVKAYDAGQAAIKQSEQRLKDGETEASRQVGETFAPQTAEYLLAAWRVHNRRKVDSAYKLKTAIEGPQLQEFLVDRWLQALSSDPVKGNAAFQAWFDLVASENAKASGN